jgi:hypothetical protein
VLIMARQNRKATEKVEFRHIFKDAESAAAEQKLHGGRIFVAELKGTKTWVLARNKRVACEIAWTDVAGGTITATKQTKAERLKERVRRMSDADKSVMIAELQSLLKATSGK